MVFFFYVGGGWSGLALSLTIMAASVLLNSDFHWLWRSTTFSWSSAGGWDAPAPPPWRRGRGVIRTVLCNVLY